MKIFAKNKKLNFGKKVLRKTSAFSMALALVVCTAMPASAAVEYALGFENYVSGTNTIFQGTVPEGTTGEYYSCQHEFSAPFGTITLNSEMANWGLIYPEWGYENSWSWNRGFTISNVNAENTDSARTDVDGDKLSANSSYSYANYYGAVAGTENYPNANYSVTVGGAGGSDSYAVLYGAASLGEVGGTISFETPVSLKSLNFTNTVSALAIDTYGNNFCQAASEDNWAALIVQGWNSEGVQVGQKVLMLYDYCLDDYVVTEWTTVDFENIETKAYDAQYYGVDSTDEDYQKLLEDVADGIFSANNQPYLADGGAFEDILSLTFIFDGSDKGSWGINFPVYAALDDLVLSWLGGEVNPDVPVNPSGSSVPEPASWALLAIAMGLGIRRVKKR